MSKSKGQDYKVLDPEQIFDEINTLRQEIKSLQKSVVLLRKDIRIWRFQLDR
jgi:hypothetical protein